MLDHASLLVHTWTRTTLPDGHAWIRAITDDAKRPLGFVRQQKPATLSWLFWLRQARLDVFETEDAAHLMSLTRSWTMLPLWDLHDAEDRHVGAIYPKALITSVGESAGLLDLEQGCIFNSSGHVLARFVTASENTLEVSFTPGSAVNPFLRMLMLGCVLTLDPKPKNA